MRSFAANVAQHRGIGRADDEAEPLGISPGCRQVYDMFVEGYPALSPGLNLWRAGVGSVAQDEDSMTQMIDKGLNGVSAQVRVHRHGICFPYVEGRMGVCCGSGPDVASLGVQDHGDTCWDTLDRFLQAAKSFYAQCLVEGVVRLIGADQIRGRFDDRGVEGEDIVIGCWDAIRIRVQPHTEQAVISANGRFQFLYEVHGLCFA